VKGATEFSKEKDEEIKISIHAPVKGATSYVATVTSHHFYFNPRTREGCDFEYYVFGNGGEKFQSTHP